MQVDREGRARDPETTKGDLASITERLTRLERRVQDLSDAISRFYRATAEGEPQLEADVSPEDQLSIPRPAGSALATLFFQTGRSLLVLAGAFLVRAVTEGGLWPRPVGAAIGLAYAFVTLVLARRAAKRAGGATSAAFLGVTAVLIADPLIGEASTKFAVLSPAGAAAALFVSTALCLAVALESDLPALSWAAVLGFLTTGFALIAVIDRPRPLAAAILAMGAAMLWTGDGRLRWRLLSWPTALAADGVVAYAVWTASDDSSRSAAWFFALTLLLAYLGSFAVEMIVWERHATAFVWLQTAAVLVCGLGGAAHIAGTSAARLLGVGALAAAAGTYVAAPRADRKADRAFAAAVALALTIWGATLALSGPARAGLLCLLALASVWLDRRFGQIDLRAHAALFTLAAAWETGLLSLIGRAWYGLVERPWSNLPPLAIFVWIVAIACWAVLLYRGAAGSQWRKAPGFLLALLSVAGAGALVILFLERLWEGETAAPDLSARAAIRTVALAVAALALAVSWRRARLPELAALATLALALGGIKFLVEDFPQGRPASLFVAFVCYGAALILVPRTLRRAAAPAPAGSPAP